MSRISGGFFENLSPGLPPEGQAPNPSRPSHKSAADYLEEIEAAQEEAQRKRTGKKRTARKAPKRTSTPRPKQIKVPKFSSNIEAMAKAVEQRNKVLMSTKAAPQITWGSYLRESAKSAAGVPRKAARKALNSGLLQMGEKNVLRAFGRGTWTGAKRGGATGLSVMKAMKPSAPWKAKSLIRAAGRSWWIVLGAAGVEALWALSKGGKGKDAWQRYLEESNVAGFGRGVKERYAAVRRGSEPVPEPEYENLTEEQRVAAYFQEKPDVGHALFQEQQALNEAASEAGAARGTLDAMPLAHQIEATERFSGAEIPLAMARAIPMIDQQNREQEQAKAQALNQLRRAFMFQRD